MHIEHIEILPLPRRSLEKLPSGRPIRFLASRREWQSSCLNTPCVCLSFTSPAPIIRAASFSTRSSIRLFDIYQTRRNSKCIARCTTTTTTTLSMDGVRTMAGYHLVGSSSSFLCICGGCMLPLTGSWHCVRFPRATMMMDNLQSARFCIAIHYTIHTHSQSHGGGGGGRAVSTPKAHFALCTIGSGARVRRTHTIVAVVRLLSTSNVARFEK